MPKIAMYFDRMQDVHLHKDVGMVAYYIAKYYNLDLEYITAEDCSFDEFRSNKIIKIKRFPNYKNNLYFYLYLLKNARNIDVLMTIHCRGYNLLIGLLYKILNPGGVYYIKADQNYDRNEILKSVVDYKISNDGFDLRHIIRKINYICTFKMLKYVDLLSVEQKNTYEHVNEFGICNNDVSDKLFLMENGFDDYYSAENITVEDKENVIISTGRIGAKGKNHELLLEVIKEVELFDWKIYLVGPIEGDFGILMGEFFKENPNLKEKIILVGNIDNKCKLYEYYKKAKIFVFTSENEGYPLVFPEARYFGNYIITTRVGGSEDITLNGKYGKVIEQGDKNALIEHLQLAISDPDFLNKKIDLILRNSEELKWGNKIAHTKKLGEVFNRKGIKNEDY